MSADGILLGQALERSRRAAAVLAHPRLQDCLNRAMVERHRRLRELLSMDDPPFRLTELEAHLLKDAFGVVDCEDDTPDMLMGMRVAVG